MTTDPTKPLELKGMSRLIAPDEISGLDYVYVILICQPDNLFLVKTCKDREVFEREVTFIASQSQNFIAGHLEIAQVKQLVIFPSAAEDEDEEY